MKEYLDACAARVNAALERFFFDASAPQGRLYEAMKYSLMAGGKRIRPVLTLEFAGHLGADAGRAMDFACAVEMVHTYSLIHDDLPCMDNDDFRRGRPSNHRAFDEATALLAGDALLTAAFGVLCRMPDVTAAKAVRELAFAAGETGMVAGQYLDLDGEGKPLTKEELFRIYGGKTCSLLAAACRLGVIAAQGGSRELELAGQYGRSIGLAFQIRDDVLDALGDEAILGKPTGSDRANDKTTFYTICGEAGCAALVNEHTQNAIRAARELNNNFLVWLAGSLAERNK